MDTTLHHRTYTKIRDDDATNGRVEMARGNGGGGNDKRSRSDTSTVLQTTIATGKRWTRTKPRHQTLPDSHDANTQTQTHTQNKDNSDDNDNYVSSNIDGIEITDHSRSSKSSKTDIDGTNNSRSSKASKTDTDTFSGEEEVEVENTESTTTTSVVVAKRRRVSFKVGFAETEVIEIPVAYETESSKADLYYSDDDYDRFRASELKRYNKMVKKKLQKMVQERIQPEINEAVANGATLEDIEAMVPKTHEEMVAYLGGEDEIRKAVGSSFGSQLNGNDDRPKKQTIRSSRSSIELKRAPNITEEIPTENEDDDIPKTTNPNEGPSKKTNLNPNSGSIRLSNPKRKPSNDGGNTSVRENAAGETAAAARIDAQRIQEDCGGEASSEQAAPPSPATVASLKEIDAMVPTTHAEMVAYLGAKRASLEQLELSPKGPSGKWTIPSSRRFLEEVSATPGGDDDDADTSSSGRSGTRGSKSRMNEP